MGFFTRGLPYGVELRERVYHLFETSEIYGAIDQFFEKLELENLENEFNTIHIDSKPDHRHDDRSLQR